MAAPKFNEADTLNIKKAFQPLSADEKLRAQRYDLAKKIASDRQDRPGLIKGGY